MKQISCPEFSKLSKVYIAQFVRRYLNGNQVTGNMNSFSIMSCPTFSFKPFEIVTYN